MQECRNVNPAEVEKVFRFPRTLARKQEHPKPSKELATVCWPCRTWSEVCPQSRSPLSRIPHANQRENYPLFVCPSLFLTELCCWLFITPFSSRR